MPKRSTDTPKVDSATTKKVVKKTVKKNALEKKFFKFLEGIQEGLVEKINEVKTLNVSREGYNSEVVFATFSANGKDDVEIDEDFNVQIIKDILFAYHTEPDKPTNFSFYLEVIPATDNSPFILAYEELRQ